MIVLAVLAGFGLRLGWAAYAAHSPAGLHDPIFYFHLAQSVERGDGYRYPGLGPTAYYPIGYPAILAAWFWLMQHSPFPGHWLAAAVGLNILLSTASIGLAGVLGRRLAGPWVGAVTAVIVALFPSLIYHSATILTETTFNFVFLVALVVICWRPWNGQVPSWTRLVVFSLLLGLSIEVRPIALLAVPMVLIALWRVGGTRLALGRFAVVVGVVIAVMIPWTVRNAVVMKAFLPIGTTTGDNLCIGNNPTATGHYHFPAFCYGNIPGTSTGIRPRFEIQRNSVETHRALTWIFDHPSQQIRLLGSRLYWEFQGDHDAIGAVQSYGADPFIPLDTARTLGNVADAYFYLVAALALIGIPALLRGGDRRRLLVLLAIVAVVIAVLPFFGDPRFHVPINVLIPVPAALAIVALGHRLRPRLKPAA